MVAQKRGIGGGVEGATVDHDRRLRQGRRRLGRIDEAQQVMVLRFGGKGGERLLADGKEDAGRIVGQRRDGGGDIRHVPPVITRLRLPRRAFQRDQGRCGFRAGGDGVPAHPCGEGVGRVDDMGDAFVPQIIGQPRHPAEAAHAHGQGLGDGRIRAACIGKDGIHPRIGQGAGQTARLGRAAEEEDARHV